MKRFPIQGAGGLTIPWKVAEQAYAVYSRRYGCEQSLERIAERGGFGVEEMNRFLPNWGVFLSPAPAPKPRPAHIRCPWCDTRHLDVGEWETRPHHKHKCAACGKLFRVEGEHGEYFYGTRDDDHYAGAGHDHAPTPPAPSDEEK